MMTTKELSAEFWMLTKGILQDSNVDTDEARVDVRILQDALRQHPELRT